MDGLMLLYIIIGTVGLAYFLITLVVGEVLDGFDGLFDGDADVDIVEDGPSPLSGRVIAAAMVGFGAAGVIGQYMEWNRWATLSFAVFAMLAMSVGSYFLVVVPLYKMEHTSNQSVRTYVGLSATVLREISPGRTGRVEFVDPDGINVRKEATTDGEDTLVKGAVVTIHQSTPNGVLVR